MFNIFHKLTCKSQYVTYLMECILCKIQYVEKSGTSIHLRLNNHMIPTCHRFKTLGHDFVKHAIFSLIEQISETSNVSKDTLRIQLK